MATLLFSHPDKPLKQHLEAVATSAEQAVASIPWNDATLGTTLQGIARLIGLYHDVGKGTSYFQKYLLWNVAKRHGEEVQRPGFDEKLKSHALLSAVAVYIALKQYLAQASWGNEEQHALLTAIGFYVVRQHHQDLEDNLVAELSVDDRHNLLHKQIEALDAEYFANLPYWDEVSRVLSDPSLLWIDTEIAPLVDGRDSIFDWNPERFRDIPDLRFYVISLVLFSSLLDGDKLDASNTSLPQRASVSISSLDAFRLQEFGESSAVQNDISMLRERAYQTAVQGGINNINDHICSLSLPTGSGKTLAALGWALSLRDHLQQQRGSAPRIIYALPFISIVDQNYDVFKRALTVDGKTPSSDILLAHTHLSDTQYHADDHADENTCLEPTLTANQQELLVEGWESEVIVTTFVQLFETFFSGRNRMTRRFANVAGSIVILDEVQAFPHKYWLLFQRFAETMANLTGTYFLLCTATQPAIFDAPHELAPDPPPSSTSSPRTEIVWKADHPCSLDEFVDLVVQDHRQDPGRYLVVLNTIGSAEQVYRKLREEEGETTPMTFLSTYLCPVDRLTRIRDLRAGGNASGYVVSTQLIEAGVDIDAHAAYRDMAPLDSIIQVAGRVNRGGQRDTERVTIVSLQNEKGTPFARFIYDPLLRHETEKIFAGIDNPLPETQYADLSRTYYGSLRNSKSDDVSRNELSSLSALDFSALDSFTLIQNDRPRASVFVELDNRATVVLESYRSCKTLKDPWERRAKWLSIKAEFLQFVVNVPVDLFKETGLPVLEGSDSFFYLPSSQLTAFYDPVTGFNQGDTSARIW
ncbi:MAG: CRISPR-associated helicase Cas3' [Candidatus Cryosericum sp.]